MFIRPHFKAGLHQGINQRLISQRMFTQPVGQLNNSHRCLLWRPPIEMDGHAPGINKNVINAQFRSHGVMVCEENYSSCAKET